MTTLTHEQILAILEAALRSDTSILAEVEESGKTLDAIVEEIKDTLDEALSGGEQ